MKSIYITRNITLQREGQEDVVLQKGHHTVADDVAEHPFVKHHVASVEDAGEGVADLQALLDQTRIAAASEIEQLKEQLDMAQAIARSVRGETDALRTDLERGRSLLQGAHDEAANLRNNLAAALATVAERDATIAAYAAMTPAVEPKGKAK